MPSLTQTTVVRGPGLLSLPLIMKLTFKTSLIAALPNAEIVVRGHRLVSLPLIINVTLKMSLIAALLNTEIILVVVTG